MPARAVIFDFNGTLSDDEPIMYRVYAELFAAHGRPLSPLEYRDRLAGHTDEEIVRRWLGPRDDLPALVRRRVDHYQASVRDGATVSEPMRRIVRSAAARVPVGLVSGAARVEVAAVLSGARLTQSFAAVVTA